jgi:hypothetical protein
MSDFRYMYKADFDGVALVENEDTCRFVLKAVKPARIT